MKTCVSMMVKIRGLCCNKEVESNDTDLIEN